MSRIRWYGPTLVLLATVLSIMIVGPSVAKELAHNYQSENIRLVRESLSSNPVLDELSNSFRKVATVVEPSVVHIQVASRQAARQGPGGLDRDRLREWFFGPGPRGQMPQEEQQQQNDNFDEYNPLRPYGNGSGWVYDEAGHIVTNNHVIEGADVITVRFFDGTERTATVVGTDPKTDTAVLKVEGGKLHPAVVSEEPVQQGDIVFAFGSPFGFKFSMSQGIVSAVGRNELGIIRGGYENFIQTDAAINPGNSGGPLTDIHGRVIGMNTAIASRTGASNGLGFAIPADSIIKVVDALISTGKVTRGFLGIEIGDLEPRMARTFGYTGQGVLVVNPIPDTPGARAGLKEGDIIVSVDGKTMHSADQLRNTIANTKPGTQVNLKVFRDQKTQDVTVTVGLLPEQFADASDALPEDAMPAPTEASREVLMKLGIERAQGLSPQMIQQLGITGVEKGVLIQGVRRQSIAAMAGVIPGVIVTHVMGEEISSVNDLVVALNKHDLTQGVRVRVMADGRSRFAVLDLPKQ